MKITAGFLLLVCVSVCSQIRWLVRPRKRQQIKQGRGRTQEEQGPTPTQEEPTAPEPTGTDSAGGGLYGLYPTARQAAD